MSQVGLSSLQTRLMDRHLLDADNRIVKTPEISIRS